MAIETRINKTVTLLNHVRHCNAVITIRSFNSDALNGIKDEMKDILDEVKAEINLIKSEVDNW